MNIAIIPARGGSRRIPKKNIKKFNGKPIIAWSIKCAKETKIFNKIIVSTDDKKVARIAKKFGAEVPFIRSSRFSKDSVGIIEVVSEATKWLLKNNIKVKNVCCIFPTAPLMKPQDIRLGYKKLIKNNYQYVFSSTTFPSSIYRSLSFNKKNTNLKICFPKKFNENSIFFYDAGQFYWGKKDTWIKKKKIFSSHSATVEIPRWRVQDINNSKDWIVAQKLFKGLKNNAN